MLKKMLKHITNNPALKILSIVLAVALWLIVVSVDDPNTTKTFTVDVTVVNENVIADMDKVYDIVDGRIATFSATGKRSQIEKLTKANFTATADLSQMNLDPDKEGTFALVPIEVESDRYSNQIEILKKTNNMQITIEDRATKPVSIYEVINGSPAEGYALDDNGITLSHRSVEIEGPESVVSKIVKGTVTIEVGGSSSDITTSVVPVFYDEEDNIIRSDRLELNPQSIDVTVRVLGTKKVPIKCEGVTASPADGYSLIGSLEWSPEVVEVKGEASALKNFNEIVIPTSVLNSHIEGKTKNLNFPVDITEYLTDGISLVKSDSNVVAIQATIEAHIPKVIEIPVADIVAENLPEGYQLEYGSENISITVRGLQEDIDEITVQMFQAKINLEGLEEGSHVIEAEIMLPDKVELVNASKIQVKLIKEQTEEDENGELTEQERAPENDDEPDDEEENNGNTTNNIE